MWLMDACIVEEMAPDVEEVTMSMVDVIVDELNVRCEKGTSVGLEPVAARTSDGSARDLGWLWRDERMMLWCVIFVERDIS